MFSASTPDATPELKNDDMLELLELLEKLDDDVRRRLYVAATVKRSAV